VTNGYAEVEEALGLPQDPLRCRCWIQADHRHGGDGREDRRRHDAEAHHRADREQYPCRTCPFRRCTRVLNSRKKLIISRKVIYKCE